MRTLCTLFLFIDQGVNQAYEIKLGTSTHGDWITSNTSQYITFG